MHLEATRKRLCIFAVTIVTLVLLLIMLGMVTPIGAAPSDTWQETGLSQRRLAVGPPDAGQSSLTVAPTTVRADGVSTAQATAWVLDASSNPVPNTFVRFDTSLGSVIYQKAEAESAQVSKSPSMAWSTWTSGADTVIYTDYASATASWSFQGTAIAIRYLAAASGGLMRIQVDSGAAEMVDTYAAADTWKDWTKVNLSAGSHAITVTVMTARVHLDYFQSGATTGLYGNTVGIITSANLTFQAQQTAYLTATIVVSGSSSFEENTTLLMKPSVPDTVAVTASPDSIEVGGNTSTIEATVKDEWNQNVPNGTVVKFSPITGNYATVTAPSGRAEAEDASKVTLSGTWTESTFCSPSGGKYIYATAAGATATHVFTGSALILGYIQGTGVGGIISVTIGSNVYTQTLNGSDPCSSLPWVVVRNLGAGQHTAKVTVMFVTPGKLVGLDYFEGNASTSGGKAYATLTSKNTLGGQAQRSKTVTAQADSKSDTVNVTITAKGPATITVNASPNEVPAGSPISVDASAVDEYGNPCKNGSLFSYSDTQAGTWQYSTLTTSGGVAATNTYTPTLKGSGFVNVTGSAVGSAPITVTAGPLSQTLSSISALPSQVFANGTDSAMITVIVRDQYGNMADDCTPITVTASLGTISGSYARMQAENWSPNLIKSGAWNPASGSGSDGGYMWTGNNGDYMSWIFESTSVSFAYYEGTSYYQAQVQIDGSPPVIVITHNESASGWKKWYSPALVFGTHRITVTNIVSGSWQYLSLDYFEADTTRDGQMQAKYTADTTVGTANISANVAGQFTLNTTINQVAGPAADIIWNPTSLSSSCGASTQLRVRVKDAWGHYLANEPVTLTVTPDYLGSFTVNPVYTGGGGGWGTTYFVGNAADSGTITGTAGSGYAEGIPVSVSSGTPALAWLFANPTQIVANGISTSLVSMLATDACLNCMPDGTPATFSILSGPGNLIAPYGRAESEAGAPLVLSAGWTFSNAVPSSGTGFMWSNTPGDTIAWTFTGSLVEVEYYEYAAGGWFDVYIDGVPVWTQNTAGGANAWKPWTSFPLPFGTHTVTVSVVSGFVNIDYLETRAVFYNCWADVLLQSTTTLGTAVVQGQVGAVANTTNVDMVAGPPYTLYFNPTPLLTAQCGVTDTLGVWVADQWGHGLTGELVDLETNGGGYFNPNPVTTVDSAWVYADYLGAKTAGTGYLITGTVRSNGVTNNINLNVNVGAVNNAMLSPSSANLVANGTNATSFVLTVYDACGNTVSGQPVSFTKDARLKWQGASSGNTSSQGQFTVTVKSATPPVVLGSALITGTFGGPSVITATVNLIAGLPNSISITANPTTLICNGTSFITATVNDQWLNVVKDEWVQFTSQLDGSLSPASDQTDSNGEAHTLYTAGLVGTETVTATCVSNPSLAVPINLTVNLGPTAQVVVSNPSKWVIFNDGSDSAVVTATLYDACQNPVGAGRSVTFTLNPTIGASFVESGSTTYVATTGAGSSASATVTGTVAGKYTVTASGSGLGSTYVYVADNPWNINLSANPSSVPVYTAATIEADVRDALGNPVVNGTQIRFETDKGELGSKVITTTTVFDPVAEKSVASAVLTNTCVAGESGTATITGTIVLNSRSATTSATLLPGALAAFEFDTISSPQQVSVPFAITIRAKDACGNLKFDYNGSASLILDPVGSVSPPSVNFVNGVWTGLVSVSTSGGYFRIKAQSGAAEGLSNYFEVTAPPTPSPTPVPPSGTLLGRVAFQRPGVTPPHPSWSKQLLITLGSPLLTYTVTTDQSGYFTATVAGGIHNVLVKHSHTLANLRTGINIPVGGSTPLIDFGTLREGDANNDNYVTMADFYILKFSYNKAAGDPGFDPRADFNEDSYVTSIDFNLLKSNFNQAGDVLAASPAPPSSYVDSQSERNKWLATSAVRFGPARSVDDGVEVDILVQAGDRPVDSAEAHLNFPFRTVQVLEVIPGQGLSLVLQNEFDNVQGTVDFAAALLEGEPVKGEFVLATLRLSNLPSSGKLPLSFVFASPTRRTGAFYQGRMVSGSPGDVESPLLVPSPSGGGTRRPSNAPLA